MNIFRGLAYAGAIVAPLLLLIDPGPTFPEDWSHHLGMIGYHGEYFRRHGDMPTVMNLTAAVGISQPVFYGYLLYPVLGFFSAFLGAAMALRVGVLLITVIGFWALLSAGRNIFRNAAMNYTVAASVVWATYSLTDLYNRGAIAEYCAITSLVAAVAFAVAMATEAAAGRRYFYGWMAGLFLLLTLGAHPPTAVLAAVFFALLGASFAVGAMRGRLKPGANTWLSLAGGAALGAVILAPWVYATALFGARLSVSQLPRAFLFLFFHCDSWWGRFAPYPYDPLSTEKGVYDSGAAYLEAPINMVLLTMLVWNLELCRRIYLQPRSPAGTFAGSAAAKGILAVAICWFLFLVTFSVSPALADAFRFFGPYVQYVYRLVSHCNVALLIAVFASGIFVAKGEGYLQFRQQTNLVVTACLTVAVLGLLIKLQHAGVVQRAGDAGEFAFGGERTRLVSEGRAQLAEGYNVPSFVPELTEGEASEARAVLFPVGLAGPEFGEINPARIELKAPAWVVTNAVVFPWMVLLADGAEVDKVDLARKGQFFAVRLPVGSHELQAVWRPSRVWSAAHRISRLIFGIVLGVTVIWAGIELLFGRHRTARPDPHRGQGVSSNSLV